MYLTILNDLKCSSIPCAYRIVLCVRLHTLYVMPTVDGPRKFHVSLLCCCKTMQNTSVINDDLLILSCVTMCFCRCQRSTRKWQSASQQWMECVSDLTLFLAVLYLVTREMSHNRLVPFFFGWIACKTDRCHRWNLNLGPVQLSVSMEFTV